MISRRSDFIYVLCAVHNSSHFANFAKLLVQLRTCSRQVVVLRLQIVAVKVVEEGATKAAGRQAGNRKKN